MDILKVDGVALPAPHSYTVTLNDLDSADTGRTEDGMLVRQRLRGGVAKISVQWKALSTADCAAILNATAPYSISLGRPARPRCMPARAPPSSAPPGKGRLSGKWGWSWWNFSKENWTFWRATKKGGILCIPYPRGTGRRWPGRCAPNG